MTTTEEHTGLVTTPMEQAELLTTTAEQKSTKGWQKTTTVPLDIRSQNLGPAIVASGAGDVTTGNCGVAAMMAEDSAMTVITSGVHSGPSSVAIGAWVV